MDEKPRRMNPDQEMTKLNLLKLKGMAERIENFVENTIKMIEDGSLAPVGPDWANKFNKLCSDAMKEAYDDFIEVEDEVVVGPIPKTTE